MDMERLPGNTFRRVGSIGIGAIHPDARELLDRIMVAWEDDGPRIEANNVPPGRAASPYQCFYWLTRWSGLIDPTAQLACLAEREAAG
jgi:hypothetical protein